MYKKHYTKQSNDCLICFSPLLKEISIPHLLMHIPLCPSCLDQFQIIDKHINFHHYPLRILYHYNAFFRDLLFQYKGLYDYALKDAFLCLFLRQLSIRYYHYIVVVAPSSDEDNHKRGFAPMETIAYTFTKNVFVGLYKKEKYKQSDLSYAERQNVKQKIGIRHGEVLKGKKVLILDDVVTSGSTLLTCLNLVLAYQPQSVELLALSTKKENITDMF